MQFLDASFGSITASVYAWETLYSGHQYDDAVDMYIAGYRSLLPPLGCWLSRDPLRAGDCYRYCNDAPLNFVDPRGLEPYVTLSLETAHDKNVLGQCALVVYKELTTAYPSPPGSSTRILSNDSGPLKENRRTMCRQLGIWIGKRPTTAVKLAGTILKTQQVEDGRGHYIGLIHTSKNTYEEDQTWDIFVKWKCMTKSTWFQAEWPDQAGD